MSRCYLLIFVFLLIGFSCSKNNDNPLDTAAISKIIYGDQIGLGTYEATYVDGLLTELASVSNDQKIVFDYNERGDLSQREFYALSTGELLTRTVYTTNSAGQILEKKQWRNQNNTLNYEGRRVFEYLNGALTKIDYYGPDDISVYNTLQLEWEGQNPVKVSWFGQSGNPQYTTEITYDLSQTNTFNNTFPNSNELYAFEFDFLLWQSLSKNTPISSMTFHSSGFDLTKYDYILLPNGLTDQIYYNDKLWLQFEYEP